MPAKICVSATGNSIDSQIDPRFGRCPYFVVADEDMLDYEGLPNTAIESAHGAGTQAAQLVVDQNVRTVITGRLGPNAYRVLSAAGINVVTGATGTVKGAIQKYKSGELRAEQEHITPKTESKKWSNWSCQSLNMLQGQASNS